MLALITGHTQYDMESDITEIYRVPQELSIDKSSWKFAGRVISEPSLEKSTQGTEAKKAVCAHMQACCSCKKRYEQSHSCKKQDDLFKNVNIIYCYKVPGAGRTQLCTVDRVWAWE